jgi:hypothetical protein
VAGRGLSIVVIEAGVATAYVIAWALRKTRRVGDRLDTEADRVIDVGLDKLHEIVENKLSGHPVLAELVEEAEEAGDGQQITDLTRQQLELALISAAKKDDIFAQTVTSLVKQLRNAEQAAGKSVISGPGSTVFTGSVKATAESGGIAVGQAGSVTINGRPPTPLQPGRIGR